MLFREVFSNLRCNLGLGHFIHSFNADDASAEIDSLEPPLQFALCLAGTEYQD
jgi:hypothetical protein